MNTIRNKSQTAVNASLLLYGMLLVLTFIVGVLNGSTNQRFGFLSHAEKLCVDVASIPFLYGMPALIFVGIPALLLISFWSFYNRRLSSKGQH